MTLSPRQLACLQAYAETGDYRRAAEKLGVHWWVVRDSLSEVRTILGTGRNTVAAFAFAVGKGWIAPHELRLECDSSSS